MSVLVLIFEKCSNFWQQRENIGLVSARYHRVASKSLIFFKDKLIFVDKACRAESALHQPVMTIMLSVIDKECESEWVIVTGARL